MRTLASALSLVGREALRIVLPSWCVACENELPWRERTASICRDCWSALPKIEGAKCSSCALPVANALPVTGDPLPAQHGDRDAVLATGHWQPATRLCIACIDDPLPLDWCEAWGHYQGPLERALTAMKFRRHDFLDDALASLLAETLRDRDTAFDAIVAVPMSKAKERARGYNQAELLARALARRAGAGCDMTLLTRIQERATQSMLPKRERAENVRGAFAASSRVKGKSILVVDDICTTGETLRACAAALGRAGATRVCAIAVAKAS